MVSIKTIAEKSGFSTTTISRYINNNGYISKKAMEKIEKVINDLNYTPSLIARSLKTKTSNIIGLILPDISSPYLSNFVEGVESESIKKGYNIFLCHSHEDVKRENIFLRLLAERRVDGIISYPVVNANKILYKEVAENIPIVFTIRKLEELNLSSITVDDFSGSYDIVKYLIQKGHRRIGFINGIQKVSTGKQRWEGAKAALHEFDINQDFSIVKEADYTVEGGYRIAIEILKNKNIPTAIYAANNLSSIGALTAIKEKGLQVPQDISLIGFDGFEGSYAEKVIIPRISANVYPSRSIGEMAVQMVINEIRLRRKIYSEGSKDTLLNQNIKVKVFFEERDSVKSLLGIY